MASTSATAEHDTKDISTSAEDDRSEARKQRDRWQDESDRQRRQVRDRTRREARHGANASRDAVRSYVRATTDLVNLLIPPAFLRPGEMLRTTFDLMGQAFDVQRSWVDEMVLGYRDNLRYMEREAERDERVDDDEPYGYYEEDFDSDNGDERRESRQAQRARRQRAS
jgi:hypothetical protein